MSDFFEPYMNRVWHPSDINEHLPTLFTLALQCRCVVEFGVRSGCSTTAFLAALKKQARTTALYSYDINDCIGAVDSSKAQTDENTLWTFIRADTSKLEQIPDCDMLFIDTLHTYKQVVAEVEHHKQVRRWMVFHDTVLFGQHGERGQPGIRKAIETFVNRNPEWFVLYEYKHNNGLMILQKR